jgi:serine/threonine protein kinase
MTYEEMLNAKGGYQSQAGKCPFGVIARLQTDSKYHDVLTIDAQWAAIPAFRQGLQADCMLGRKLNVKQQIRYEIVEADGKTQLELEAGSYQTLEQAIDANPSLVVQPGFVDGVISGLLAIMGQLHSKSAFHICFSPRNVFVRKGDNMPMLLLHGSSFTGMRNAIRLFEGQEDYIAPELKEDESITPTPQSDIYSLGKLITWIFSQTTIPFEYKSVITKATCEDPSKRFASSDQMEKRIASLRSTKQSFMVLIAALTIALITVWLYFELTPQTTEREFIEGAPKTEQPNPLEDGFDPELEMILEGDSSSSDTLTAEERLTIDDYMKKAEEIFRRRYTEKADGILSKVYNNESMNSSEKTFMATSSAMSEELINLQNQLAEESGIPDATANRIASEVVSKIIAEKQKTISSIEIK